MKKGEVFVGKRVHVQFIGTVSYVNQNGAVDVEVEGGGDEVGSIEYIPVKFLSEVDANTIILDDRDIVTDADGDFYIYDRKTDGFFGSVTALKDQWEPISRQEMVFPLSVVGKLPEEEN